MTDQGYRKNYASDTKQKGVFSQILIQENFCSKSMNFSKKYKLLEAKSMISFGTNVLGSAWAGLSIQLDWRNGCL